jgi:RimJ/RimL family protein N-acetyltransferase
MHCLDIPTLVTERLRLRPLEEGDLDNWAALCADPEVNRWMPWGALDRGAAWRNLIYQLGHWLVRGSGIWAVEEKSTGAFVGRAGFADGEGWPGFELGGALMPQFWRRGYATEAGRAALDFAFRALKKDHVIGLIRPGNFRSIRAAERLGESFEGSIEHLGKEALVYGIDRESWAAQVESGVLGLPGGAISQPAAPPALYAEPPYGPSRGAAAPRGG